MKKYQNFTKYFNTVPRTYALILMIFYGISLILCIAVFFVDLGIPGGVELMMKVTSLAWAVIVEGFFVNLYVVQSTLKRARIGKQLKKNYGLTGEALDAALAEINTELENPLYADATKKKKFNSFFVTKNWIVGTEGIMLLRANAVKLADIQTVEKNYYTRTKRGFTLYYYVVQLTTKSGRVHRFYLRSEENVDMACEFLLNVLREG